LFSKKIVDFLIIFGDFFWRDQSPRIEDCALDELNSSTGGRQTLELLDSRTGESLESTLISSSSSSVLLELELEMKNVGEGLDLSSENESEMDFWQAILAKI